MDMNMVWNEIVLRCCLAALALVLSLGFVVWIGRLASSLVRCVRRSGIWAAASWCLLGLVMVRCGTVTLADKAAYPDGGALPGGGGQPQMRMMPRSAGLASLSDGVPAIQEISADDYAAGAVLSQVVMDETHDFTPPADAVVFDEWCRFGATEDWFRLEFADGWHFPFAGRALSAVTVYAQGFVRPSHSDLAAVVSPLGAALGFVPAAVSLSDGDGEYPSRFWYRQTEVGSLVLTWENALLGRDAQCPVSFQAELFPDGDAVFRYDLSHVADEVLRDVRVAFTGTGAGRAFTELSTRVTTLRWSRLDPAWADVADPDGDGASTSDEVLVMGTDPANADSDGDGILDGLDPYPTDPDADGDGIADGISAADYFSHPLWSGGGGSATGVLVCLNAPVVAPAKAVLRIGSLPIVLTTNAVYRLEIEEGARYDIRLTTNHVVPVNLTLGRAE